MNDLIFLLASFAVFLALLGLLLASSRFTRAVFTETVFHPFTPSRIEEYDDGEVRVVRESRRDDPQTALSKQGPMGVR